MTPTSLATAKRRGATSGAASGPAPAAQANVLSLAEAAPAPTRVPSSRWSLAIKHAIDFGIAMVLLILTAPLFLLIAACIKITSRGPVLFTQTRVGQRGKVFRFYKFRTMQHNSDDSAHREFSRKFIRGNGNGNGHEPGHADEAEIGSVYKMTSDPRITSVGRVLRRTSLDELPQLINVIQGHMSLVGPRPPVLYELEHYQDWHRRRLDAKPGITGLWQVSGRSSVPFDEMVQLDLFYIDHRSLKMDLWIMARTLPVMIKGDGAY